MSRHGLIASLEADVSIYRAMAEKESKRADEFQRRITEAEAFADTFLECDAGDEPGDCDINHYDWRTLMRILNPGSLT